MQKKAIRILAMMLIVVVLLSTTAALAATYTNTTKYSLVTCGDKLIRSTKLYIMNTSSSSGWINATVTSRSGCGASRTICSIPKGNVGSITFYTGFGQVGQVEVTITKGAMMRNYSCSLWTSDGSTLVRTK